MGCNFYLRGHKLNDPAEVFGGRIEGGHLGKLSGDSFAWAIKPEALEQLASLEKPTCHACKRYLPAPDIVITDEEGGNYTVAEFQALVKSCKVQTFNLVGQWFS